MKERVTGMVLSAATIGEYDKRVVLLTKERGRISAFARGARRPRSPLSAATEPFTFGEFFIYRGRDSYSIEQVEVENYFPELRQNLEHLYLALYFCEVADYFTREGMTAKHELNLLYLSLRALSVPSLPEELVRYIYEFRMLAIAGEAPRIFECIRCGKTENLHHFYVGDAGIVCDDCHDGKTGILLSETAIYTLQRILSSPLQKLYTFSVSEAVLFQLKEVVSRYFKVHTDRTFHSLDIFTTYKRNRTTYGKWVYNPFSFAIMALHTKREAIMKITIELDENLPDDEIRIHCRRMTEKLQKIQEAFASGHTETKRLVLYQGDLECYVDVLDILFFETEGTIVQVHTRDEIYETKQRLYELEEILPNQFLRVSKSTIANVSEIYSLQKSNLSTTSCAAFRNSHKQIFVSRHYSRVLKEKLVEMRMR